MSINPRIALVLGPKGVTGFTLIEQLLADPQWDQVVTVARSAFTPRTASDKLVCLRGDLLDQESLTKILAPYPITHIFFAAHALLQLGYSKSYVATLASFQSAKLISPVLKYLRSNSEKTARYLGRRFAIESEKYDPEQNNLRMLSNTIAAAQAAGGHLQHVSLVTGTAYHGIALGPYFHPQWKSHFEADDPPVPHYLCFYYELEAALKKQAQQQGFSYSIARPGFVIGYGENPTMNIGLTLAVYALIMKELDLPLYYPGIQANYKARWQMSTAEDIARVMIQSSVEAKCQNQTFLVANQDTSSWAEMWPQIAAYFDMSYAATPSSPIRAQIAGAERGNRAWSSLAKRHHLKITERAGIANLNMLFKSTVLDWDYSYSLEPLQRVGIQTEPDTRNALYKLFKVLEEQQLIPARPQAGK